MHYCRASTHTPSAPPGYPGPSWNGRSSPTRFPNCWCASSGTIRGYPPIYVTENGAAFDDYVDPEGAIDDEIGYLNGHLQALHEAIQSGVDVRGCFCWSLMDNFQRAEGYGRRFGLSSVDYGTRAGSPRRARGGTPMSSGGCHQEERPALAVHNGLPPRYPEPTR
ncbi:family 1 glycosylhydrolase [Amycolatopsis sp.]|uniref:family 1 glycosylhydrolase n=1 Tax=Amycolatopsis sp. TaxID=37632 RepID=UPI0039C87F24